MVRGDLITALDFRKDKNAKRERYSYRRGSQWYWVSSGSGFSNTYEVVEYDDDGLALLKGMEHADSTTAT